VSFPASTSGSTAPHRALLMYLIDVSIRKAKKPVVMPMAPNVTQFISQSLLRSAADLRSSLASKRSERTTS
jgi:hypothetical protein